jgi:hypothetical protein
MEIDARRHIGFNCHETMSVGAVYAHSIRANSSNA